MTRAAADAPIPPQRTLPTILFILTLWAPCVLCVAPAWNPHVETGTINQIFSHFVADSAGNYYITYRDLTNPAYGGLTPPVLTLKKYDSSMNLVWRRDLQESSGYNQILTVIIDEPNNKLFWCLYQSGRPAAFHLDLNTGANIASVGTNPSVASGGALQHWTTTYTYSATLCGTFLYIITQGGIYQFNAATGGQAASVGIPSPYGIACIQDGSSDIVISQEGGGSNGPKIRRLSSALLAVWTPSDLDLLPWGGRAQCSAIISEAACKWGDGSLALFAVASTGSGAYYRPHFIRASDGTILRSCTEISGITSDSQHAAVDPTTGHGFLVGSFNGDVDGPGPAYSAGGSDVIIVMYRSTDGEQLILRQVGTARSEAPQGVNVVNSQVFVMFRSTGNADTYLGASLPGSVDALVLSYIDMGSCAPGYYATGNPPCTMCPAGKYTDEADKLSCKICPAGSGSDAGSSSCTLCQPGYASSTPGNPCVSCPAGFFSNEEGSTLCKTCLEGTYSATNGSVACTQCDINTYNGRQGSQSCIDCPLGSTTKGAGSTSSLLCECPEGTFGNIRPPPGESPRTCEACPANTECPRGTVIPAPDAGYWLTQSLPDTVYRCVPSAACPGGESDLCSDGYTGTGCDLCARRYFRKGDSCVSCTWPAMPAWAIATAMLGMAMIITIVVIFAGIVYALCQKRKKIFKRIMLPLMLGRRIFSRVAPNIVRFSQVFVVIISLPVPWPPALFSIGSTLDLFSLDLDGMIQISCLLDQEPSGSVSTKIRVLMVKLLVPFLFSGVFLAMGTAALICSAVSSVFQRKKGSQTPGNLLLCPCANSHARIMKVFVLSLELAYMMFHVSVMQSVSCYAKASGQYYMVTEPSVQCFVSDGDWINIASIAVICFPLFSFGFPAFFTVFYMAALPRFDDTNVSKMVPSFLRSALREYRAVGIFTSSMYEPKYRFWPAVQMWNRFFFALGLPLSLLGSSDTLCYMVAMGVVFLALHMSVWPYKNSLDDTLEFVVKMSLSWLAISGLMLKNPDVSEVGQNAIEANIGICLLLTFVAFLILAAITLDQELEHSLGFSILTRLCCFCRSSTQRGNGTDPSTSDNGKQMRDASGLPEEPSQDINPFEPEVDKMGDRCSVVEGRPASPKAADGPQVTGASISGRNDRSTGLVGQALSAVPRRESMSAAPTPIAGNAAKMPISPPPMIRRPMPAQRKG